MNYTAVPNEYALNFTVGKYIFHVPDAPFGGPVLALMLNILKGQCSHSIIIWLSVLYFGPQ